MSGLQPFIARREERPFSSNGAARPRPSGSALLRLPLPDPVAVYHSRGERYLPLTAPLSPRVPGEPRAWGREESAHDLCLALGSDRKRGATGDGAGTIRAALSLDWRSPAGAIGVRDCSVGHPTAPSGSERPGDYQHRTEQGARDLPAAPCAGFPYRILLLIAPAEANNTSSPPLPSLPMRRRGLWLGVEEIDARYLPGSGLRLGERDGRGRHWIRLRGTLPGPETAWGFWWCGDLLCGTPGPLTGERPGRGMPCEAGGLMLSNYHPPRKIHNHYHTVSDILRFSALTEPGCAFFLILNHKWTFCATTQRPGRQP